MTNAIESEILTRVGPGTMMGNVFRRYWLPALKSSELKADGDPVRFRLLGENLIAFRDTAGRVGVMDHRCPHRCASLWFGRNEEGGIRCVYHGWKFDVDGNCLEMANVPPHQDFKHKVHAKAYKAAERNGLVWVYMGEAAKAPALPAIAATLIPESEVKIDFVMRHCNWLQGMEGDIDTSHLNFLHYGSMGGGDFEPNDPTRFGAIHKDPEYKVSDTELGTFYGCYRPADPGFTYWRIAHFMFPCWALAPFIDFSVYRLARAWVPLDDTHMMFIQISPKTGPGSTSDIMNFKPNTTDWLGRYVPAQDATNDYWIDRAAQRTSSFTGVPGIHHQDQMVTESMGPITDHTWENPAPSDRMIIATRRRLINAAKALAEQGVAPPGSEDPDAYGRMRGGYFVAPEERKFPDVYYAQLAALADAKATVAAE